MGGYKKTSDTDPNKNIDTDPSRKGSRNTSKQVTPSVTPRVTPSLNHPLNKACRKDSDQTLRKDTDQNSIKTDCTPITANRKRIIPDALSVRNAIVPCIGENTITTVNIGAE